VSLLVLVLVGAGGLLCFVAVGRLRRTPVETLA